MTNLYLVPSFLAHIVSGFILIFVVILIISNYAKIINLDFYKQIMFGLLFSICIGIHGLSHLGLEKIYNHNPLINSWF
jgi:hypothetical protein